MLVNCLQEDEEPMADRARVAAREVLVANQAFYRAFASRDFAGMEAMLATGVPVACIHPGWNVLRGRDLVLASWRSILSSPESPAVACANATAYPHGESAYVVCEEHIADAVLIATNVFVREHGEWKLVTTRPATSSPASPSRPARRAAATPSTDGHLALSVQARSSASVSPR